MSKEIPSDGRPIRYNLHHIKCVRKELCKTCGNGKGHGPYWYAMWNEQGRLVRKYCGKNDPRPRQEGRQSDA